jgi:uncharacterized protein (DUF2336 family)
MGSQQSALEALINLSKDGSSDERRELMRQNTDPMMAAVDRYGARHMEYFDLMFTRIAPLMENRLRRALAMALTKSGISIDLVKKVLSGEGSALSQIVRRSASHTVADLVTLIRERTASTYNAPAKDTSPDDTLSDGNRYMMPKLLLEEVYRFIYFSQRHRIATQVKIDVLSVLDRTAMRFRHKIIDDSQTEVRDDILQARKAVNDKVRYNALNEELLAELLETRQMTEYLLALASFLDVDVVTTQRILNDHTWESLALACRARKVSRNVFSKLVNGMHRRESDNASALRIVGLYNKLPEDAAERVMRFLQVRVSTMKETSLPDTTYEEPQPAVAGMGRA